MAEALDALAAGARSILDRPLTQRELDSFDKYLRLLVKWQRVQRLVGSAEPAWIVDNLFLDSLLFLRVLPPGIGSLADLGSGAGIPGIPIKVVTPGLDVALIESRSRRASFLAAVVRELGLPRTRVVSERVQGEASVESSPVDAVVMRCAGDLRRMVDIARRLVRPGGVVVASGPPEPRVMAGVEWIVVTRPSGERRWFAVATR